MRGVVPCTIPVHDLRQQHVCVVDLLRVDEDEIFASERSLACRFGYCYVIWENLLTPSPVGWHTGSVLTVFLDLFVSEIRGSGTRRTEIEADARRDSPHIRSLGNSYIIVPVKKCRIQL